MPGDGAFLQREAAAAIRAVDVSALAHVEIDSWMTQRAAAAIAAHDMIFRFDGFRRFHC